MKNSSGPTHSCHFVCRDVKMHVTLEQQQILLTFLNRQSWTMNRFSVYITILRILKIKSNKKRCHLLVWYALRIFRIFNIHLYILRFYRSNFQILFLCVACVCHHLHNKVTIGMELKERRDWNIFACSFNFCVKNIVLIFLLVLYFF